MTRLEIAVQLIAHGRTRPTDAELMDDYTGIFDKAEQILQEEGRRNKRDRLQGNQSPSSIEHQVGDCRSVSSLTCECKHCRG